MLDLVEKRLAQLELVQKKVSEAKKEASHFKTHFEPIAVKNYSFATLDGEINLSDLFGDKEDLIFIHNMGKSCKYCTLWADLFNGGLAHYQSRAGIALGSPDPPAVQSAFAKSRNWQLKTVSFKDDQFSTDFGFHNRISQESGYWPGILGFHKSASGKLTLTGLDDFGPGDDYCTVWPTFDLLDGGVKGFEPQ